MSNLVGNHIVGFIMRLRKRAEGRFSLFFSIAVELVIVWMMVETLKSNHVLISIVFHFSHACIKLHCAYIHFLFQNKRRFPSYHITKTCPCNKQSFFHLKKGKIHLKKFDIFNIFAQNIDIVHTCDEFERGIREIFHSFQGGFRKMYRIYRKILGSFQGDFEFS